MHFAQCAKCFIHFQLSIFMRPIDHTHRSGWLFCPRGDEIKNGADVFFLYPTVYIHPGKHRHNMNPYHLVYRFFAWCLTVWRAAVFKDSCNVFTPHYRQVGMEILDMTPDESQKYLEIAYSDVKNAFYHYINNLNGGRPFVLAGHSQGAEQLLELMKREFKDGAYADRFVGAYLIGYSVTKDDLAKNPHLKIAQGELDTGSIVTYNTSAEGLKLMKVVKDGAVCVNPLNWVTTNEYAPPETNLGSVLLDLGKCFRIERRHFTGAYIDTKKGVLMIDRAALNRLLSVHAGFLNSILLHRGTLHMLDIALFHRNLQKNVKDRLASFNQRTVSCEGK